MADDALDPPVDASLPLPSDEPDTSVPEVEFGKILSAPDNFLGAGYSGKGWTIVSSESKSGQPVVNLSRRNIASGSVDKLTISAEKYKAAKAYKDAQRGMSAGKRGPVLGFFDLGHRPLDPEGDITPDTYDAATKSYRVQLPGSRTPEWVTDDLVRDVKAGKEGALERLRKEVGLTQDEETSTTANTVNVRKPTTPIKEVKREQLLDRSSSQEVPGTDAKNTINNQTEKENAAKQPAEDLLDDEDDKVTSRQERTQTYTDTKKEGESAKVVANEADSKPDTRIEANRQSAAVAAAKASAVPLTITENTSASSPQSTSTPTALSVEEAAAKAAESVATESVTSAASPVVENTVRKQAPKSRQRLKAEAEEAEERLPARERSSNTQTDTGVQSQATSSTTTKSTTSGTDRATTSNTPTPASSKGKTQGVDASKADRSPISGIASSSPGTPSSPSTSVPTPTAETASVPPLSTPLRTEESSTSTSTVPVTFRDSFQIPVSIPQGGGGIRQVRQELRRQRTGGESQPGINLTFTPSPVSADASTPSLPSASSGQRRPAPRPRKASSGSLATPVAQTTGADSNTNLSLPSLPDSSTALPSQKPPTKNKNGRNGSNNQTGFEIDVALNLNDVLQDIQGSSREQALDFVRQQIANISRPDNVVLTQDTTPDLTAAISQNTGKKEREVEVPLTEYAQSGDAQVTTTLEESNASSSSASAPHRPHHDAQGLQNALINHELAALQELENALEQLPQSSPVPPNFIQRLPLLAQAVDISAPTEASEALNAPPPPLPFQKSVSLPSQDAQPETIVEREDEDEDTGEQQDLEDSDAPVVEDQPVEQNDSLELAPPLPTTSTPTSNPSRTRVGVPAVSSRRPTSQPAASLGPRFLQPMAMMMALNSQQALDRGPQQSNDTYSNVLNQDTSVPSDSSLNAPASSSMGGPLPYSQPPAEGEDVQTTPNQEAQAMRLASDQALATQKQFSGPEQAPQTEQNQGQTRPSSPLTPEQQLETTGNLQAAQQQEQMDKNAQQNQDKDAKAKEEEKQTTSKASLAEKTQAEITRIKLVYDLIEGMFDWSFGFLQFIAESNLAIVNDKYLKVKILPSLKIKGEDPRTERYMHYAIYVLNALLFFLLLIVVVIIIAVITMLS